MNMWVEKINQLNRVKHNVVKSKIQSILNEKGLIDYDTILVQLIIDCESNKVSYKVMVKDVCFTIFEDGTVLQ